MAEAVALHPDAPPALEARTRCCSDVPAVSPVSGYDVVPAGNVASDVNVEHPAPWQRSRAKASSSEDVSTHARSMVVADVAEALRPVGADGAVGPAGPSAPKTSASKEPAPEKDSTRSFHVPVTAAAMPSVSKRPGAAAVVVRRLEHAAAHGDHGAGRADEVRVQVGGPLIAEPAVVADGEDAGRSAVGGAQADAERAACGADREREVDGPSRGDGSRDELVAGPRRRPGPRRTEGCDKGARVDEPMTPLVVRSGGARVAGGGPQRGLDLRWRRSRRGFETERHHAGYEGRGHGGAGEGDVAVGRPCLRGDDAEPRCHHVWLQGAAGLVVGPRPEKPAR